MNGNLRAALVLDLKDQLSGGLEKITKAFEKLVSFGKKIGLGGLENASGTLNRTAEAAQGLTSHLRAVANTADRAWGALKRMAAAPLHKMGEALGKQGKIGAFGAAAEGYSVIAPVRKYAELENITRHIAITEGLSGPKAGAESQRLIVMVQGHALATSQSSVSIAQALQDMIQTGIRPELAEKLLPIHSMAATAYNIDPEALGHAVFALSDSFKIGEGDMGGALASMAQASKEGRFKVEDFSRFLPSIGGNMSKLGMTGRGSADLAFAMLETVMKNAADPGTGASNFTQFMADLTSPHANRSFALQARGMSAVQKQMIAKFHLTGIKLSELLINAEKQHIPLPIAFLMALQEKLKGRSPVESAEILGAFFGNQQSRDAAQSLLQHYPEFRALQKRLGTANSGMLERDFDTANEAPKKKLDLLYEQLDQLMQRAGSAFMPLVVEMNRGLGWLIEKLRLLDDRFPGLSDNILLAVGSLLLFGAAVGLLGFVAPAVTTGFGLLKGALVLLLKPLGSLVKGTLALAGGLNGLVAFFARIVPFLLRLSPFLSLFFLTGDTPVKPPAKYDAVKNPNLFDKNSAVGKWMGHVWSSVTDPYALALGLQWPTLPQMRAPGSANDAGDDGRRDRDSYFDPRGAASAIPPITGHITVGVDPDNGQIKINKAESTTRGIDFFGGMVDPRPRDRHAMIDIIGLYDGVMLQASYAGIGFWIQKGNDEAGRRTQRFRFPGQDQPRYQDLGQDDGEIVVNGIYVGDDYIHIANRLRAAFQQPAPGTLVHPWLGTIQVVQAPGKSPRFEYREDELRVLRFRASFYPWTARAAALPDTLTSLLDAVEDLRTAATQLLATVLAPVAIALSVIGYVESFASAVQTIWTVAVGNITDPAVAAAAAAPIAALGSVETFPPDATYTGNVSGALGAVSAAIAGTSTPILPTAVATGGSTVAPVAVDGRVTATLILAGVTAMTARVTDPAPAPTVVTAAQLLALADATAAVSTIAFDSQQEASALLTRMLAALTAAAKQAAALAAFQPAAGGAAWRALVAAKAALSADMTATIGRLPAVTTFIAPTSVPVWLLAHYLAGDRPETVLAVYLDLVRRNQIPNPAVAPAGALEVLL